MTICRRNAAAAALATTLLAIPAQAGEPSPARPVATYSIVAHDAATGELGVAVQSHWFQVGPIVAWAEAGVGAVATQSFVDPSYGPLGLELMRAGKSPEAALQALLAVDEGREVRQVAMVDAAGRVATWTGGKCIAAAGHEKGEHFSVQANLMDRDTVWPAMAAAFRAAEGDLAERMLVALEAAEAEGGDIRGRQSAALLVVAAEPSGRPWVDRRVDLRIADHPDPLAELRRLLRIHRAYEAVNAGDVALEHGDLAAAFRLYGEGAELAPEIDELRFWQAVTLWGAGHRAEAEPLLRDVLAADPRWRRLLPRLLAAGLVTAETLAEIEAALPAD